MSLRKLLTLKSHLFTAISLGGALMVPFTSADLQQQMRGLMQFGSARERRYETQLIVMRDTNCRQAVKLAPGTRLPLLKPAFT